jgi:predicted MFS family arabinose efflux permease
MQASTRTVGLLACTQIISWGSLYYAFTVLAPAVQREFGWSAGTVFGAFSWSLLVAGIVSAPVGALLDHYGGRLIMAAGSAIAGAGLIALSQCHSVLGYFVAWSVLGVAMSLTLYEAAFAAINRKLLTGSRQAISRLTLFGGFASTVFWPLAQTLETHIGWRQSYLLFGALHLTLCLVLHLLLGADPARVPSGLAPAADNNFTLRQAVRHPAFWKLAMAFAANSFIFSSLSVHLIPLLQRAGHPGAFVVLAASVIGPMQVLGRIGEMTLGRHARAQTAGIFTFAALPAALCVLWLFGAAAWAVAVFCILYGLSNGVLTIVRGTIPQALFGRRHYGAISGALAGPSLLAKAAGPLAAALLLQAYPQASMLLVLLLMMALASLGFYLGAISSGRREGAEDSIPPANPGKPVS